MVWYLPGYGSEVLEIYLGEAIIGQRLCEQVERVADLMPRPYAFVKQSDRRSQIKLLELDLDQLLSDATLLERESKDLVRRAGRYN